MTSDSWKTMKIKMSSDSHWIRSDNYLWVNKKVNKSNVWQWWQAVVVESTQRDCAWRESRCLCSSLLLLLNIPHFYTTPAMVPSNTRRKRESVQPNWASPNSLILTNMSNYPIQELNGGLGLAVSYHFYTQVLTKLFGQLITSHSWLDGGKNSLLKVWNLFSMICMFHL